MWQINADSHTKESPLPPCTLYCKCRTHSVTPDPTQVRPVLGDVNCQSEAIPLLEGNASYFSELVSCCSFWVVAPALSTVSFPRVSPTWTPPTATSSATGTAPRTTWCTCWWWQRLHGSESLIWALLPCPAFSDHLQRPFFSMQCSDFYFGVVSCRRPKQRC